MHILHAVHGYPPEFVGGTELYVRDLCRHQVEQGHEVTVLAGSGQGQTAPQEDHGVRVYHFSNDNLFHERWDRTASAAAETFFLRTLDSAQPDLVHVHHWLRLSHSLVRRARSLGLPVVVGVHDFFPTCPRIFRIRPGVTFCERPLGVESCLDCVPREDWMDDDLVALRIEWFASEAFAELEAATAIVTPSRAHAEQLARFSTLEEAALEVVPPASADLPTAPELPQEIWSPEADRPLRVAHWGNLDAVKGVHLLLQAVGRLRSPASVEVVLWGDCTTESYAERIEQLSSGIQVERHAEYTRAQLSGLRADLAVFPSLAFESHSLVLDEAFALQMPALVSDRGALPERVGEAGAVVPADNVDALRDKLEELLSDDDALRSMRAAIPKVHSIETHWKKLEEIYSRCANNEDEAPGDPTALAQSRRWEKACQSLEARARELGELLGRTEGELNHVRGEMDKLTRSNKECHKRIEEQESDLDKHRSELARTGEDLTQQQGVIEEQESDLDKHRSELARTGEDLETHRQELARVTTDLDGHREVLGHTRWRLEAQTDRLDQLERENKWALPLILPVRLWLRLWDRIRGSDDQGRS